MDMKLINLFAYASVILFINCCEKNPEEIPVTSVSLSQATAEMIVGETVQLSAKILPSNATEKTIIWSSSKQSVATITQDGLVTALSVGTSNITAMAGGKTGTCVVTVSKKIVEVSSIELNKTELSLVEGEEFSLTATVKPEDATDKTVTWSSSDATIASVAEGKVKGIKEGSVIITAKAGETSASCSVIIAKKTIAVTSIGLNKTTLTLTKGQSENLVATVQPEDATDKSVTWTSSNKTIATVENGKVTAIGGGEATITAKAGEVEAACVVTVTVPVSSVSLNHTTLSLVEGEEATLTATVKPDDVTDKTVIWTSSNPAIASVENGKVYALLEGKATITARAGNKEATCSVSVQKKIIAVTGVSLNKTTLNLNKGQAEVLTATVTPSDATDKTISWSSSNPTIASVNSSGQVSALKSGNAVITAKVGEKSASCSVTVSTPVESISLDCTSVSLEEGQSITLVATINPSDADEKTVEWRTSNTSVATVTNGEVTAVGEGTCTITAMAGNKTAECKVAVTKYTPSGGHEGTGEENWN